LKRQAVDIEARERARILEGRHGIRRQPDITFKAFAAVYRSDHAEVHKRSVDRDREIIKVLKRSFGSVILHELTAHRIEQFKRERLAGKWRGHKTTSAPKPIRPATVNRELDTLKSILSKAVEWGKLRESPARLVKRLKVDNRRTRILTDDEQRALFEACPRKMRGIATLGAHHRRAEDRRVERAAFEHTASTIGCRRVRRPGDAGRNQRNVAGKLVDGRRLELPTSALRTSPESDPI